MNRTLWGCIVCSLFLFACRTARTDFRPDKTYDPSQLKEDLQILSGALESHHPGLYWYQSTDHWQKQLDIAKSALDRPLTEPAFRKILRPLVSSVRCGHTSIRPSKQWEKYSDTARIDKLFPLSIKCWSDTMIVLGNLDPKDSVLARGTQILSINGRGPKEIYAALFPYIVGDGFNETHKYQVLSGWGSFGSYYRQYLDTSRILQFEILDSAGEIRSLSRTLYKPVKDTTKKAAVPVLSKKEKRNRRLEGVRSLQIDRVEKKALLRINSFGQGGRLKKFFRQGFKLLNQNGVEDLIIDVRNNGGGRVGNSTALTRYVADHTFKIADTLYAIRRNSSYGRHIVHNTAIQMTMPFLTKKKKDGLYHFGYFERHRFSPKNKDHFKGRIYVLSGGYSFSATTLFINAVKGQKNTTVIGEETGGGAYGNSAWEIPELLLPNTLIRMRLPLFRMVMSKDLPNNGRGVMPDISVGPTVESVRKNYDNKLQTAFRLIQENRRKE